MCCYVWGLNVHFCVCSFQSLICTGLYWARILDEGGYSQQRGGGVVISSYQLFLTLWSGKIWEVVRSSHFGSWVLLFAFIRASLHVCFVFVAFTEKFEVVLQSLKFFLLVLYMGWGNDYLSLGEILCNGLLFGCVVRLLFIRGRRHVKLVFQTNNQLVLALHFILKIFLLPTIRIDYTTQTHLYLPLDLSIHVEYAVIFSKNLPRYLKSISSSLIAAPTFLFVL